ncbi:MAG: GrpB family protein, partial [Pseudomonadota bacterium]
AKPVIDIMIGLGDTKRFPEIVERFLQNDLYIYYKIFEDEAPNRRLFVRLKDTAHPHRIAAIQNDRATIPHEQVNQFRIAHIHVWEYNSTEWIRHYKQKKDIFKKTIGTTFLEHMVKNTNKYKELEKNNKQTKMKEMIDGSFEAFLAVHFLMQSDQRKYGSLSIFDIELDRYRGRRRRSFLLLLSICRCAQSW